MASAATINEQQVTLPERLAWWPQITIMAWIAALVVINAIWLSATGVKVVLGGTIAALPLGALFLILGGVYGVLRPAHRLALASLAVAEIILFSIPGCIFSYAVMGLGRPLFDDTLAAWDAVLQINWRAYVGIIDGHPWLAATLGWAYASSFYQLLFLSFVLALCGRFAAVNRLLGNFMIGGIIVSVIGALFPALGGYHHFGIPDHGISSFIPAIEASRTGNLQVIDMDHAEGLVMFPSFHTQTSIALILAAWSVPVLRYPFLLLNVLVVFSTPIFGAHYFVDVIAGFFTCFLFDFAWRRLEAWRRPTR
jgi:membrane-associated phospholipid phosphatase